MSIPTPNECTINGWLWYCDVHDTHGNADLQIEAEAVAKAHKQFWAEPAWADPDGCDIVMIEINK